LKSQLDPSLLFGNFHEAVVLPGKTSAPIGSS
jgi:hypothetical protein